MRKSVGAAGEGGGMMLRLARHEDGDLGSVTVLQCGMGAGRGGGSAMASWSRVRAMPSLYGTRAWGASRGLRGTLRAP